MVVGYGRRSMFRHHSARGRAFVSALFLACALMVSAPAGATAGIAQQDDEAFDANETEGTIERVRYQLLGVAAVTGALLVGYIWHTDPQRRLRVATRRRENRERAAIVALEDEFVLASEADLGTEEGAGADDGDDVAEDTEAAQEASVEE